MTAIVVMDRSDDGQLVHHLGLLHHEFTEDNTGDIRAHRSQWPTVFHGSIWLGIVRLELGRPPASSM